MKLGALTHERHSTEIAIGFSTETSVPSRSKKKDRQGQPSQPVDSETPDQHSVTPFSRAKWRR